MASYSARQRHGRFLLVAVLMVGWCWWPLAGYGQAPGDEQAARLAEAERRAQAALQALDAGGADDEIPAANASQAAPRINVLELALSGGPLMYPILLMSVLVVGFAVERGMGLRRRNVVPVQLVRGLGELASSESGLEPRGAYKLCQQYPSSAAKVIRTVLLKVGRPHAEVERAVTESCHREAARLYKNVRILELAAAVTPLIGLLGTVQGMIMAFFTTATAGAGINKAEQLADGIYTALVTTFAGLSVAIPAAVLAHFFEGRIQSLLGEVEELLANLLPQWERYEGKLRITRAAAGGVSSTSADSSRQRAGATESAPQG